MPGTPYPLTRGYNAVIRVNLLQHIWQETLGYLLHPTITNESRPLKIADVGTATGVWLCELSSRSPTSYQFDGFDISSDNFIAAQDLPQNVKLRVMDASKPPPEEDLEMYDVVHIRLLQSVVKDNDPDWIVTHCLGLLKPGGYLCWEEHDPLSIESLRGENASCPNLDELVEVCRKRAPGEWVSGLPLTFSQHHLQVVAVDRKRELLWHRLTMTLVLCLVFEEYASVFLDQQGPPGAGDELRRLAKAAFEEAMRGSSASYVLQGVVARKSG